MRNRLERKEELTHRPKLRIQQYHRDNAKTHNAYARLHRKGWSEERKNVYIERNKAYYNKNRDFINEKKPKRSTKKPRTIEDIEKKNKEKGQSPTSLWSLCCAILGIGP